MYLSSRNLEISDLGCIGCSALCLQAVYFGALDLEG